MNYLFLDASGLDTFCQAGTGTAFRWKVFQTRRDLAARIPELLDEMLGIMGLERGNLDLLAVGTGPGSLTGLRVAGAFFRASAFVLGKPLLGIDLFRWAAASLWCEERADETTLLVPALMGKAFAVDLVPAANGFSISKPVLLEVAAGVAKVNPLGVKCLLPGIPRIDPSPVVLHDLVQARSEPAVVAETGHVALPGLQADALSRILEVLPLYIIPSQAEVNLECSAQSRKEGNHPALRPVPGSKRRGARE